MSEANEVETGIVASGTAKVKRDKPNVPRNTFIPTWNKSASAGEAAEKLGMSVNSATARASKHRNEGFVLKFMPQGGGAKIDPESTLLLCAESMGITLDEARALGAKQKADADKRAAERAAKKAAK